jgi:enoyl-CoA hydratase/carnithine racemase
MDTILQNDYEDLDVHFDEKRSALWILMRPSHVPSLTLSLLNSIRRLQEDIANCLFSNEARKPKFLILSSQVKNVFCLGIDLPYMLALIKENDKEKIKEYLDLYMEVLFLQIINLNFPIIGLTFINGKTYGAGVELALSNDLQLATNRSQFGFPSINLGYMINIGGYNIIAARMESFTESSLFHGDLIDAHVMEKLGLVKNLFGSHHYIHQVNDHLDAMLGQYQKNVIEYRAYKQKILPSFKENFKLYSEYTLNCIMNIHYADFNKLERIIRVQRKMCTYNSLKKKLEAKTN